MNQCGLDSALRSKRISPRLITESNFRIHRTPARYPLRTRPGRRASSWRWPPESARPLGKTTGMLIRTSASPRREGMSRSVNLYSLYPSVSSSSLGANQCKASSRSHRRSTYADLSGITVPTMASSFHVSRAEAKGSGPSAFAEGRPIIELNTSRPFSTVDITSPCLRGHAMT